MSTKRNKYFYSHIVDTASISIEIADMDMTPNERKHLIELAEANVHHAVLDTVLSELPQEHTQDFLLHLRDENHDKIWDILKSKTIDMEIKIIKVAENLKKELHKDIEEAKKKPK